MTLGHQSNRRNIRNVGKPHRCVVEEEGSLASIASSEHDTFSNSVYNSKGEESKGSKLLIESLVMKEYNKAPSSGPPRQM
jgi:hypothetical protein